ncbi:MAG: threonine/serine dehydratase [Bacillota bacterium]
MEMTAILTAANRLRHVARCTPLEEWEDLSARAQATVTFKMENLQVTNSFKIRGAYNRISLLGPSDKEKGVITASAGNHAQGVALACRLLGVSALVVVPEDAPATKVEATRRHGAEVRFAGRDYDEAERTAWDLARATGRTFIHAFEDPQVVAGQGTVGLEILQAMPDVDTLIVPMGGGGLIAGVATAAKAINPGIRVIGVQSEASPPWYHSIREGRVLEVTIEDSIAEGLAGSITEGAFEYVKTLVDEVTLVSEAEIWDAMGYAISRHHLVVEGSGAVTIAAIRGDRLVLKGRKVAAVLTGGNVDPARVKRALEVSGKEYI